MKPRVLLWAGRALQGLLAAAFAWVWLPAAFAYAVLWFARFGWDLAEVWMEGL